MFNKPIGRTVFELSEKEACELIKSQLADGILEDDIKVRYSNPFHRRRFLKFIVYEGRVSILELNEIEVGCPTIEFAEFDVLINEE